MLAFQLKNLESSAWPYRSPHGFLTAHNQNTLSHVRLDPIHRPVEFYVRLGASSERRERRVGLHNRELVVKRSAWAVRL
jgi:hypothetical protein